MRGLHTNLVGALAAMLMLPGAAQAELFDRGGGFIYDDVLNVTWTQNANINGPDNWENQVAWAESLSIFDSVRGVTWSDWRLASADVNGDETIVDCSSATELECRDNEYGYLFHVNAIRAGTPGPFANVQSSYYWSETEFRPNLFAAWVFFFFGGGSQAGGDKTTEYFAWAVRDGDVAADTDNDGVADVNDNCQLVPNGPDLPDAGGLIQYDSNNDGFGNACDPDLNNDGTVNFSDLGIMRSLFFSADRDADLNGDGLANFADLEIMKPLLFSPPGPSGLVP